MQRPDLLLIGTLLHDIGKGFPGDHTEVGMTVAGDMAHGMGLDDADVESVVTMVRLHLLLPDTATRRDLDDPATADFASVGSPRNRNTLTWKRFAQFPSAATIPALRLLLQGPRYQ